MIDAAAKTRFNERPMAMRCHSKHCWQTMAEVYVLAGILQKTSLMHTKRPASSRRGSQTVEKPLESSRGPEFSRAFNRARRRVRRARDDFCGGKSHFPEQKSSRARKSERFFAKTGRGGSGGGACSPVHQLVKNFFDKLRPASSRRGSFSHSIPLSRSSRPAPARRVSPCPCRSICTRPAGRRI